MDIAGIGLSQNRLNPGSLNHDLKKVYKRVEQGQGVCVNRVSLNT